MEKEPAKRTRRNTIDTPVAEPAIQPPLKPGGEAVLENSAKGIKTIGNPDQFQIMSKKDGVTAYVMEIPLRVGCIVAVEGCGVAFVPNVVVQPDINGGVTLGKPLRRNRT